MADERRAQLEQYLQNGTANLFYFSEKLMMTPDTSVNFQRLRSLACLQLSPSLSCAKQNKKATDSFLNKGVPNLLLKHYLLRFEASFPLLCGSHMFLHKSIYHRF